MTTTDGTKLLFVTTASNAVGLGHLNRCLSIAASTVGQRQASFFVFGDQIAETQLNALHCAYRIVSPEVDDETIAALRHDAQSADIVITDVVHPNFFLIEKKPQIFEVLRPVSDILVAIDSLGEQSIVRQRPEVPIDVLVVPYAISETERVSAKVVGQHQLLGVDYAMLSPEYLCQSARRQRINANRILVTCGGSDPLDWTSVILNSFEAFDNALELRVVVGPLFSEELKREVDRLSKLSRHFVTPIVEPKSLAEHMLWCDLAIAASGLTKYELAATGTPTLLFSVDASHEASNQSFSQLGIFVDLGAAPSCEQIASQTLRILGDYSLREKMGNAGQALVDGAGAKRLISDLMDMRFC